MNRTLLWAPDGSTVIEFAERPGVAFQISKEEIGRGASCIVYHAVSSDHTEHLLKEYYPKHLRLSRDSSGRLIVPEDQLEAFEQGLARFRTGCDRQKDIRLSNESLKNFTCNVQGYYQANGTEYIDMTCFSGLTYDHVQEKTVYSLMLRMRTLAQVVGNYHKAGLLHLDIKPENIYVRPEDETVEDVMLFDFDSATPVNELGTSKALSCTKAWAAPEQLLSERHRCICYATDLFAIGEIIFVQLFGRHSTSAERRSFVSRYPYDRNAEIFKDMNPKVFPLLDELLCNTICGVVSKRYQTADELIAKLDEIIALATPEKPYLKSSPMTMQNFFIGRDDEILEIHQKLNENRILFLSGIGGIGKSELAKHYAAKYKESYDVIVFVSYLGDVNMLLQDDISISLYNFARYPEEKPEEYCNRKLRKLQELCDERTLFIVDNLDRDDDPDLKKLLELNCKLLVTTRMDFSEYGLGQQLLLDVLQSRQEIRAIFDKHYTKALTQEENDCVEQIIDLVAGHTMTVELLAKQMMAGRGKPDKMLAKLQEGGISESGTEKVRSGKDGTLSAQSTYDHIQTLFDLSELDEKEKHILANLSLIPYTGIPTELFHDWCELETYDGINGLVAEGWVRHDKERDYISLHPIISDVVEETLDKSLCGNLLSNFSVYISNKNNNYNSHVFGQQTQNLVLCLTYKFAEYFLKSNVDFPCEADILYKIGGVFFDYCDYAGCEKVWIKALEKYSHAESAEKIAAIRCDLALLYAEIGDIKHDQKLILKAIDTYQTAIPFFEELADWSSLATVYNNIGSAYHSLKKYEDAISMYHYSIDVHSHQEDKGQEYISSVAMCYNNIGVLYKDMDFCQKSVDNYTKSLDLLGALPPNNVDNALVRHNLAVVFFKRGSAVYDLSKAKSFAEDALYIRRICYPNENIRVAQSEELLARILMEVNTEDSNEQAEQLLFSAQKPYFEYYGKKDENYIRLQECLIELKNRLYKSRG